MGADPRNEQLEKFCPVCRLAKNSFVVLDRACLWLSLVWLGTDPKTGISAGIPFYVLFAFLIELCAR